MKEPLCLNLYSNTKKEKKKNPVEETLAERNSRFQDEMELCGKAKWRLIPPLPC